MYPVSEAFLQAVQENTRNFYWTGKITTKAGVEYPFTYDDIVKGSGYVAAQCCGSSEIELVTMFAVLVDEYIFPDKEVKKSSVRRRLDAELDKLNDKELSVIEATVIGLCKAKEPED